MFSEIGDFFLKGGSQVKKIRLWTAILICLTLLMAVSCSKPPADEVIKTLITEKAKDGLVIPERRKVQRYVQVESVEVGSISNIAGDYTFTARVQGTCEEKPLITFRNRTSPRTRSCDSRDVAFSIAWKHSSGSWEASQEYVLSGGGGVGVSGGS